MDIQIPGRILFGLDIASRAGEFARGFGDRTAIITEAAIHDNVYLGQLKATLERSGVKVLVHDELQPYTSNEAMQSIVAMVKAGKPHSVIGFGGMKALVVSRAAAALANSKMTLERFLTGEVPSESALPHICIPTTGRDHFMAQPRFIITDGYKQRPVVVQTQADMARIVLLDPKITASLSPKFYSVIMMDILLSAVESFTSSTASFLSDPLALKSIENIAQALTEVGHNPRDIRPRVKASEAGMLAAMALAASGQGLGGAIGFAANARYTIPRAWVSTAILPFVLELHAVNQPHRVSAIARALGEDTESIAPEDAALRAAKAVRRIMGKLELPSRLRDINLTMEMLPEIGEIASSLEFSREVPFNAGLPVINDLLKQAF